jgi:hypothetical protein
VVVVSISVVEIDGRAQAKFSVRDTGIRIAPNDQMIFGEVAGRRIHDRRYGGPQPPSHSGWCG